MQNFSRIEIVRTHREFSYKLALSCGLAEQLFKFGGEFFVRYGAVAEFSGSAGRFQRRVEAIIIIDSMDLLTDSSGRKYGDSGERLKRIAVANDLKDIASEEEVWVVVTYQARIENPDWVNDEKNVLTEYSSSEAKGIAQPLTHLITLNQSANERREKTMRIHIAKSRFFPKGDTFKIATNYDHEMFFDRCRTANL